MLTYNLTSDIKQDGHLKIDIPTSLKNAKIELLIVVNPVEEKKIQKYDFITCRQAEKNRRLLLGQSNWLIPVARGAEWLIGVNRRPFIN